MLNPRPVDRAERFSKYGPGFLVRAGALRWRWRGEDHMVDQIEELAPREAMDFDVVIVGAGPAGPRDRDPS